MRAKRPRFFSFTATASSRLRVAPALVRSLRAAPFPSRAFPRSLREDSALGALCLAIESSLW